METKIRSFDDTRRMARHLGEKLKVIEEKMPFHRELHGKARQMLAVSDAMSIIARTPNASINDAALAAFENLVDETTKAVKEWAKEIFKPEEDEQDLWDDEIPF